MTETDTPPTEGGAATPPAKSNPVGMIGGELNKVGGNIVKIAEGLAQIPGTGAITTPFAEIGQTIQSIGTRLQDTANAYTEGEKSGGFVGGALGGLETLLGPSNGPNEEGETSSLDKVREKVSALKKIWDEYYEDLRNKDGTVNTEKLKNLALEVGETILGTKKMAKIRKAFALAEIIRSRAEAVMIAAKSAPFPFNLPAIAFAVATGQAQQALAGQTHDGLDKIPSTGTYLLEKGERVVGRRLNQDLSGFLQSAAGTNISNTTDRTSNRTSSFNPIINMSFGAGADPNSFASSRGAVETMIREIYADYAQEAPFGA